MSKSKVIGIMEHENNSHLNVDGAEVEISQSDAEKIDKIFQVLKDYELESATINVTSVDWLKDGKETNERLQHDTLKLFNDRTMVFVTYGKHCGSEVETEFFSLEELGYSFETKDVSKEISEATKNLQQSSTTVLSQQERI